MKESGGNADETSAKVGKATTAADAAAAAEGSICTRENGRMKRTTLGSIWRRLRMADLFRRGREICEPVFFGEMNVLHLWLLEHVQILMCYLKKFGASESAHFN